MDLRSAARSLALHLPVLGRLIRERAQFAAERDAAVADRDAFHHQLVHAIGTGVDAVTERDGFHHERDSYRAHAYIPEGGAVLWVPPGHFYSPSPALDDVRRREAEIFDADRDIPGVDLRPAAQRALLQELVRFYPEVPFPETRQPGHRYFFENPAYSWSDGILYHCMLRHIRPKRVIEVGSGYSSALALDTNDLFLDGSTHFTFIEPFTDLLHSLIRPDEECEIIESMVQDVPVERFQELESGDILFIDSTHAAKAGGDVNYLYFEVLPRLRAGVYVHIHDVFDGFEYPAPWVYEGRAWNELYVLRAMLIGNPHLEVQLMNSYIQRVDRPWFEANMPNCLKNCGGNIWLRTA